MSFVGELRSVIREPGFDRLYATRLVSQGADGVFQASLAGAVLFNPEHQTSAAALASSFVVILLPYSLVGPFAGVFLDRWRRQRVLVWANLARAAIVSLVAVLVVTVGATSIAFFGAALAAISVNRFYLSALSAALPHVVPESRLVMANSVSTTSGTLATFAGGGFALGLRHLIVRPGEHGDAVLALLAASVYALSSLVANEFGAEQLGPESRPERAALRGELAEVARGFADGARHVWHQQRARHALAAIAGHRLCYGVSTIATVLLYRNYFTDHGIFRAGLTGIGEVFAAGAIGVLGAAVATPAVTGRLHKETWIGLLLLTAAVVELALGLPYRQDAFIVAAAVLGFVAQGTKICVDTIVQEAIADAYLGRVFSVYDMLFNLTFIAAAVISAMALPPSGKSYPAVVAIAVGYGAIGWGYATATSRRAARLGLERRRSELTPAGG